MEIQLIRHATLFITYHNKKILLDPLFSPAQSMDPVPLGPHSKRNPLVELPVSLTSLTQPDGILLTHSHRDHFDEEAAYLLPKETPFFCQPPDIEKVQKKGFKQVAIIEDSITWEGIEIIRTGGKHGTGPIGMAMGPVSGYVLRAPGELTLYVTGDTIWCEEVEHAIKENQPNVIVCFAGAARFCTGNPITMDEQDILQVCQAGPHAQVLAVHMESWNHCRLTRDKLRDYLQEKGVIQQVRIPQDGEILTF